MPGTDIRATGVPRVGFVLERSLGHVTHADNLKRLLPHEPSIAAEVCEVPFEVTGVASRIPVFATNWTVRAGWRARKAIRQLRRDGRLDALFIHTQVPAVLAADYVRRIPTIVSVDATPLQYDELGAHYAHEVGNPRIEALKFRANRACFRRADHIVAWSEWAKQGVIDGYGIEADKVTVVPPGVVPELWRPTAAREDETGVVRILFVGGDLRRKGGDQLLEAFAALRSSGPASGDGGSLSLELHLVTNADVPDTPGVTVHRGLTPNHPDLVALYHRSDIFCLPTRGDCLPMVLSEAGAAGLPLVSTAVAGVPEIVRHDETGLLVPLDDVEELTGALRSLATDPALRRRLGEGAKKLVGEHFDAAKNTRRLAELLRATAARSNRAASMARVLVTMTGTIDQKRNDDAANGTSPRADYFALSEAMDAELLDVPEALKRTGRTGRLVHRLGGRNALLAWACFRERRRYDAIFSDGEQIGLPFALLCRLAGRRTAAHVMIVHILSVRKKVLPYKLFRLGRHIDTMLVYSSAQQQFIREELGFPADRVVLTPFMVDTEYFSPDRVTPHQARTIATAGLEFRDYPTLIEAAKGLDAQVVVAAASHWSKRADTTEGVELPPNVEVKSLGYADLRQMYADAAFVVMPLFDVDFQAGVTTILEAMSMAKPLICSRTRGQTDVIVDGDTGVYVPPGDPAALRAAIDKLLADPEQVRTMGEAARRYVVQHCDVSVYAQGLAAVVADAVAAKRG